MCIRDRNTGCDLFGNGEWNYSETAPIGWLLSNDCCQVAKPLTLSFMPLFAESWLCGWRGSPWTNFNSGHASFNSVITCDVNWDPLSLWRMAGAPSRRKLFASWKSTSAPRSVAGARRTQNFVRWSWDTPFHLCMTVPWTACQWNPRVHYSW